MNDCAHSSTVEIFRGIMKCSNCGDTWDTANDEEKTARLRTIAEGKRIQERKLAKENYYKQQHYRNHINR